MRVRPFSPVRVAAPAKINFALHITGRREDGYHTLDSLVGFCREAADDLTLEESPTGHDALSVDGPFAADVPGGATNLVLTAIGFVRRRCEAVGLGLPAIAVHLTKNLPVAAGIGGGSADAAAVLRALAEAFPEVDGAIHGHCSELGADIPICLVDRPARVAGIGEIIDPLPALPSMSMLLVNPRVPVATPSVFRALERRDNLGLPTLPDAGLSSPGDFFAYLAETRNDLEAAARRISPEIGEATAALDATGAGFVRMSGSGGTVFAIYASSDDRDAAADHLARARPDWWIAGARERVAVNA